VPSGRAGRKQPWLLTRRSLIGNLALLSRAQARVTPEIVRLRPEIEPLVALIERTPRERAASMAAEQLRRGVSYRQLMAALFLAGIRNVNPRPPGFALHCVFVIHAAHLIGLEAPPESRLLPLFYALDNFKSAQERDAGQGDYTMRAISGPLPAPERAAAEFEAAMEAWDFERAERAVVALARRRSPAETFETLWRYGARDYRNIGHKAIFAANACRTLQTIGWQHAEPVLRSLTLGLLDFGREQRVNGYAFADQCYVGNLKRTREIFARLPGDWASGASVTEAVRELLETLRQASPEEVCAEFARRLAKASATAGAVWDAVHLAAAELSMRTRGANTIVGIHAVTAANGLRHAWLAAVDPQTRLLLLLQAAGWMAQFRTWAESRPGPQDRLRSFPITAIEPAAAAEPLERSLAEIFIGNPDASVARAFRLAADSGSRQAFLGAALRFTLAKADEVHYYKYLAALIEDIPLMSAEWQPHLASAALYYAKGPGDPEPEATRRAREALRGLAPA